MLDDLLTSLITPCSPYVRRMGYLDEAIAMRGRHRRHRVSWQPHLDNTRRFVLSAAERCRNRSRVAVLGSGLLLDLPLAELSSLFREVVLMDVVCFPEVRRQIRGFRNVSFVECDVTTIAERLYDNGRQGRSELPEASPALSCIGEDAGLVVSLNILSQLWVVPRSFAGSRMPRLGQDEVDDWCRAIVEAHYAALRSLSCDVCLVADYAFVKRDREGKVISRGSTVSGLSLPGPDASWTWQIAPLGDESRSASKELCVGAWHLFDER
jgi:hypothetical protein